MGWGKGYKNFSLGGGALFVPHIFKSGCYTLFIKIFLKSFLKPFRCPGARSGSGLRDFLVTVLFLFGHCFIPFWSLFYSFLVTVLFLLVTVFSVFFD